MDNLVKTHAIGELLGGVVENARRGGSLEEAIASGPAIPIGWHDLDFCLHGWQPGELAVAAGGPSVGRTTFAAQAALKAALAGARVDFFSLELDAGLVATRMLSSNARVPAGKIISGYLTNGDSDALRDAQARMGTLDLRVCDDGKLELEGLCDLVERRGEGCGKRLVVVDGPERLADRADRPDMVEVARRLKGLSLDLGCAVLMTLRIKGKRARRLRRAKGWIGAALDLVDGVAGYADTLLVLDRSLDELEAELNGAPPLSVMDVMVAKNGRGYTRDVNLAFIPDYLTLLDFVGDY